MEKITTFTGKIAPLPINDIDTDQIIPARFLKTTDKEGLGKQAFFDWRYDADGNEVGSTITNNDGEYTFDNVPSGDYTVTVLAGPEGSTATTPTTYNVTIVNGEISEDTPFGFAPAAEDGAIDSVVFSDLDGNGEQNPGELGISGVTILLLDDTGNVIATTITDSDGNYNFDNVAPGNYTVVVGPGPVGTTISTPA